MVPEQSVDCGRDDSRTTGNARHSFIPQHSDARILEQVIYKWRNTRRTVGPILSQSYKLLVADGRPVTRDDIQRDVNRLFRTNFENWIQRAG